MRRRPPRSTLFPDTTLFRSYAWRGRASAAEDPSRFVEFVGGRGLESPAMAIWTTRAAAPEPGVADEARAVRIGRSEEHTSELHSRQFLVCWLLLENKIITRH